MVGATCVGEMSLAFDAHMISNRSMKNVQHKNYSAVHLRKGEELGTFHLGSTVVLLLRGAPRVLLEVGQEVRLGGESAGLARWGALTFAHPLLGTASATSAEEFHAPTLLRRHRHRAGSFTSFCGLDSLSRHLVRQLADRRGWQRPRHSADVCDWRGDLRRRRQTSPNSQGFGAGPELRIGWQFLPFSVMVHVNYAFYSGVNNTSLGALELRRQCVAESRAVAGVASASLRSPAVAMRARCFTARSMRSPCRLALPPMASILPAACKSRLAPIMRFARAAVSISKLAITTNGRLTLSTPARRGRCSLLASARHFWVLRRLRASGACRSSKRPRQAIPPTMAHRLSKTL